MPRFQKWVVAFLALLAALMLSMLAATVVAYTRVSAPLPTQIRPADLALAATQSLTATPDPSLGLVRLAPLSLAVTPSPLPTNPIPNLQTLVSNPQPLLSDYQFTLGQSVQGRDLIGHAFPITDSAQGLVLVNGIHGDEVNAWPVLQSLIADLHSQALSQPSNLSLYFIESLNPDGTSANRRLNANKVDLNRNWDTYDWRTGIEISPVDFLPRGGGPQPFSEPETQALQSLLIELKETHWGGLTVLYFHAAVPPNGYVGPGTHRVNGQDLADTSSRELGQLFAEVTGYDYANQWVGNYSVTGDASTWAVAQGIRSLTIELPTRYELDDEQARLLQDGVLALINYLASQKSR
jgi:predicted deacylase